MTDHTKPNDVSTPLTVAPGDPHWSRPKHNQQEVLQGYDYHDPTGLQQGGYTQGGALTMFGTVGFAASQTVVNTNHGSVYEMELLRRYGTQGEFDFIISVNFEESNGVVGEFRSKVEHGFDVCNVDLDLSTLNPSVTSMGNGKYRVRFADGEARKVIKAIAPYRTAVRSYDAIPLQETVTYWIKEAGHSFAGLDELKHGEGVFGTKTGGSWITTEVSYEDHIASHWISTIDKYILPAYDATNTNIYPVKFLQIKDTYVRSRETGEANEFPRCFSSLGRADRSWWGYVPGWYVLDNKSGQSLADGWRQWTPNQLVEMTNELIAANPGSCSVPTLEWVSTGPYASINLGYIPGIGHPSAHQHSWVYKTGVPTNKDCAGDLRHDVNSLRTLSRELTLTKNITNRVQQHNVKYSVLSLPLPKAFASDDSGLPEQETWKDTHPVWDYDGLAYTVGNSYDTIVYTRMYAARHATWQSTEPDANAGFCPSTMPYELRYDLTKNILPDLQSKYPIETKISHAVQYPVEPTFPHIPEWMLQHATSDFVYYKTYFDRAIKKDMSDGAISEYWVNIHNWSADNKENWVYRPPPSPLPKEMSIFYDPKDLYRDEMAQKYMIGIPFYSDMWRAPAGLVNRVQMAHARGEFTPGLTAQLPQMSSRVPGVSYGWFNTNNWYYSAGSDFNFPQLPSYNAILTNNDSTWVNSFDFKYGNRFSSGYSSYKRDATRHFAPDDFWTGSYEDYDNPEQGIIHTFKKRPTTIRLDDSSEQVMFKHHGIRSSDPDLVYGLSACANVATTQPITARVAGMSMTSATGKICNTNAGNYITSRLTPLDCIQNSRTYQGYTYKIPASNCVIKNFNTGAPAITYLNYKKCINNNFTGGLFYINDLDTPVAYMTRVHFGQHHYTKPAEYKEMEWLSPLPTHEKQLMSMLPSSTTLPVFPSEDLQDTPGLGFDCEKSPDKIDGDYWHPQTFMKSFSEQNFSGEISKWVTKDDSLTNVPDGPGEENTSYVLYDLVNLSHDPEEWKDNDNLRAYYKTCVDHKDRKLVLEISKFNEDDPVEVDDLNRSEVYINKAPMYEVAAHATYDDTVNLKSAMDPVNIYNGYQSWNEEPAGDPLITQIFADTEALPTSQVQYISLKPGQLGGGTTPASTQPGARPLKAGTLTIVPNLYTTRYAEDFSVSYKLPRESINYSQSSLMLKNTGEKPLIVRFPTDPRTGIILLEAKTKYEAIKDATTGQITNERGDKISDWEVQLDFTEALDSTSTYQIGEQDNFIELKGGSQITVTMFLKEVTVGLDITSYNITLPISVTNNGITTTRRVEFNIELTA